MDRLLEAGIIFFNEARYYEAHEVWEDLWRVEQSPLRLLYQGLVQAAVGLHHLSRNNRLGARNQLGKAVAKLDQFASPSAGIDVGRFREDLRKVLRDMDLEGLPVIRIVLQS
jgi:predicted metal-dependent hydrolase